MQPISEWAIVTGCLHNFPGPGQHKQALQGWGTGRPPLMYKDIAVEVDREAHGGGRLQERGSPHWPLPLKSALNLES